MIRLHRRRHLPPQQAQRIHRRLFRRLPRDRALRHAMRIAPLRAVAIKQLNMPNRQAVPGLLKARAHCCDRRIRAPIAMHSARRCLRTGKVRRVQRIDREIQAHGSLQIAVELFSDAGGAQNTFPQHTKTISRLNLLRQRPLCAFRADRANFWPAQHRCTLCC